MLSALQLSNELELEEHQDLDKTLSLSPSLVEHHARWCNLASIQMLEPKLHRRIQSLLSALREAEQQRNQNETQLQFDIRQLQLEKQYAVEQLEAVKNDVASLSAKNADLHSTVATLKEEVIYTTCILHHVVNIGSDKKKNLLQCRTDNTIAQRQYWKT